MTATTMRIGLMADPGLPEKVAASVAADVSRELSDDPRAVGGAGVQWEVEVSAGALPLTLEGEIPLMERACEIRDGRGWDYVVYLTDLPRVHDGHSMLCEVSSAARAALVVLPALGAHRLRRRIRKLVVALIRSVQEGTMDFPSAPAAREAVGHGAVRRVPPGRDGDVSYVVLPGRWNRLRLLSGMVRSNRPGRLLSALSSCVAAAAATGAFGIFYASIWNMSDALSVPRMAAISGVVIAALSAWLIGYNGLWNSLRDAADRWRAGLDNAATIITVGLSVVLMYMILWLVLFVLGLAVITGDYLASQLGHPVTLFDYLHLSWLAASLGTLAGALGSNFDSDESIREATYNRRVHERRRLAADYQD
ncbi:hypothetical protein [Kocuria sp. NPDC057446]|uniref:hypothetical protein n=1 Tax=Kocuria sp. NPDC057446 TaxID=3346137 RepID=UPI0036B294F6